MILIEALENGRKPLIRPIKYPPEKATIDMTLLSSKELSFQSRFDVDSQDHSQVGSSVQ